jgi:hypothetical protein
MGLAIGSPIGLTPSSFCNNRLRASTSIVLQQGS